MGAITFIKEDIRNNGTGNYTCMYGNQNPGDVKNISHGPPIYLNVQESQYSDMLQLDQQSVMEGMDVSFKCMIPVELGDAIQKDGFFHLYKNGSLVDSQPIPKGLPAVTFSIQKVNRSDTGNYTCVYGKETIVNSANNKRSRPVYLDVTGSVLALYLGAGVGSGILVVLLLLIGGLLKCQQSKRGRCTKKIQRVEPATPSLLALEAAVMAPPPLALGTAAMAPAPLAHRTASMAPPPLAHGMAAMAPPPLAHGTAAMAPPPLALGTAVMAPPPLAHRKAAMAPPILACKTAASTPPNWPHGTAAPPPPLFQLGHDGSSASRLGCVAPLPALCGHPVPNPRKGRGNWVLCARSRHKQGTMALLPAGVALLRQNKSNQPLNPEDDTLTYSEINTDRVIKKKPRSAPDEANRFGALCSASALSARTSTLDASALNARRLDARCTHLDARRFGTRRLDARCTHLDARRFGASTLSVRTSTLDASALNARRSHLDARRFGTRRSVFQRLNARYTHLDALTLGARTSSSHVRVPPLRHLPGKIAGDRSP
ncbi:UNVERIFIED_CONTAM: hypothetical protein FKN15_057855 [Acipenser sinensis]